MREDVAVAVEIARRLVGIAAHVLIARLGMADRRTERNGHVGARLELYGDAEIVTAVAVTVAAAVRVEVARDFLAGVRLDADADIVATGDAHEGAAACQTIIKDAGSADPESGEPPIAQCLHLREQLRLAVIQINIEVLFRMPANDQTKMPLQTGHLHQTWEHFTSQPPKI